MLPDMAQIFDGLPNAVLVLNEAEHICLANNAAEDFFQASASVLQRLSLSDVLPFASPVASAVRQVRVESGVVQEYAVPVGTPRFGGERIVDIQTCPVQDDHRFVLLILQRRSLAQNLDQHLTQQGAVRSVSGMAAMLAHEIKNPLSGIRGAAQLLEPSLAMNDRLLAKLICEETDRIRDLVDQMEVFSDERPLQVQAVNIHHVLNRVKQLILASSDGQVTIREEYDPSLPAISGNHDQLVQVFLNLVKNAVEAATHAGQPPEIILTTAFRPGVKLSVAGSPERISLPFEVCVSDNGEGIADDLRPHIFDPFVTTKTQGRGLGLALVAKIIRTHGGIIEAVPRERGTSFRILLPMGQSLTDDEISFEEPLR